MSGGIGGRKAVHSAIVNWNTITGPPTDIRCTQFSLERLALETTLAVAQPIDLLHLMKRGVEQRKRVTQFPFRGCAK